MKRGLQRVGEGGMRLCESVCGGEWGGEAVTETGHRVALVLSSKSNCKGKRKAPFDSDTVCCLRRCQEAGDQTQLATVQSGAHLSLANGHLRPRPMPSGPSLPLWQTRDRGHSEMSGG